MEGGGPGGEQGGEAGESNMRLGRCGGGGDVKGDGGDGEYGRWQALFYKVPDSLSSLIHRVALLTEGRCFSVWACTTFAEAEAALFPSDLARGVCG